MPEAELRQRNVAKTKSANGAAKNGGAESSSNASSFSIVDSIRVLVALALISTIGSYLMTHGQSLTWGIKRPWWTHPELIKGAFRSPMRLTNDEMASYDGSDPEKPILLAINRTIYDVSASPHVYGPGGMYNTLAGKDASRSYITTCFDPVDDLVPYLGGVEEVYVPLWLSKTLKNAELDQIIEGEVMENMSLRNLIEDIQKKIGRKKLRNLREAAYERGREKVRNQIKVWEDMFAMKKYPIAGQVVGVDEEDEGKWKHLDFCEAALKQREPLGPSLQEALNQMTKDGKISLKQMKKRAGQGGIRDALMQDGAMKMGKTPHAPGSQEEAEARVEDMMQGGEMGEGKKSEKKKQKAEVKKEQSMDAKGE